jgi:hypothetical protein
MSGGGYLLGLILVITGLAISDLIVSLHGVLMNRRNVKWDWLALVAAAYIFLMIVNSWGVSFRAFKGDDVNPPLWQFLELIWQIIPLYLAARAALPDSVPGEGVNLAAHYASVSRYFWTAIGLTLLLYLVGVSFYLGAVVPVVREDWGAVAQLVLITMLIVFTRRDVHRIIVPLVTLLLCVDHLMQPLFG